MTYRYTPEEIGMLNAEIERLKNALKDARDKLKIFYDHSDKTYQGGVPYSVLMAQITSLVDEQRLPSGPAAGSEANNPR